MANISKKQNEARIAAEMKELKALCGRLSENNQRYVLAVAQALKFSERDGENPGGTGTADKTGSNSPDRFGGADGYVMRMDSS